MSTNVSLQLFETVEPQPGLGYWVRVPEIVTKGRRFYATYHHDRLSLVRTEVVAKLNFSESPGEFEGFSSLTVPIVSEGAEVARAVNSRPELLSDPDTFWMEFPASSGLELEKLKLRAGASDNATVEYNGPLYEGGPTQRLLLAALPDIFTLPMHDLESRRVDSEDGELNYDLPEVIQILETRREIEGYINLIEVPKTLKNLQRKKTDSGAGGAKDLIRALMNTASTSQELDRTSAEITILYAEVLREFQSAGHLTHLDSRGCARLIINYWRTGDRGLHDILVKSHGPLPEKSPNPVPPTPTEAKTPTAAKPPTPAKTAKPKKTTSTKKTTTKKTPAKKKANATPTQDALTWKDTPTQRDGIESKEAKLADGSKLRIVVDASKVAMLFREEGKHVEPIACGVVADMERRAIEIAEQVRKETPPKARNKRGRRCSVPEGKKNANTKDVLGGARRVVAHHDGARA